MELLTVEILIGLAVGALIGLTGLGGGVLLMPVLIFGLLIPAIIAVGSDALFNFITKIPSSAVHLSKGTVRRKVVIALALGSVPGSILDGDLARKHLSSELGFSKEHRDINIRRIGYVASEITKNGGIAICAPIAPYDSVRKQVRQMIEPYGGNPPDVDIAVLFGETQFGGEVFANQV